MCLFQFKVVKIDVKMLNPTLIYLFREDKVILLESKPNPAVPPLTADEGINLYTLAGHEATF